MNQDKKTLDVKKDIIKTIKKKHFKYHNRLNISKYVIGKADSIHNNNGVAKDICDKLKETGEYDCMEVGTNPDYWAIKIKRTSLREKYWWLLLLIGWVIGVATDIGKEWLKRKILPEQTTQLQATPAVTDTSYRYKEIALTNSKPHKP